ncbi:hypothetical protein [Microbacterium terricola]|uniref:Uncharacterized protein n=1 Tax=Microbacterium terricola TaxID=344163 RepID=A0ABM8E1A0_9MICO|nr:hypothetical protein [Microbacterium terricola]UYK40560.1 hypothetical protein OAU46_02580 [Microbacterium terricola]BDV31713.1 hypothetical protein Microterr_23730 [Microbacterium terricola]
MTERDLPEGVIDADPAGGWESGAAADETTQESTDEATEPVSAPDGLDVGTVEESVEGADPDLSADADTEAEDADRPSTEKDPGQEPRAPHRQDPPAPTHQATGLGVDAPPAP